MKKGIKIGLFAAGISLTIIGLGTFIFGIYEEVIIFDKNLFCLKISDSWRRIWAQIVVEEAWKITNKPKSNFLWPFVIFFLYKFKKKINISTILMRFCPIFCTHNIINKPFIFYI